MTDGRLLALSLALALFTPAEGAAQGSAPPLRWGADAEGGAPYIFKDPKDPDATVGFEVDLAKALERELGRAIVFTQYQFDNLLPGLDRRDFDFAMNGIEVTPDRQEKVRFGRPYYVYRLQLVARAGEDRFHNLDELKARGLTVGTLGNTAADRLLDRLGIAKRVYDSQAEPYKDLELRRIDAVLMDLPIALYYGKPRPGLRFVGEPFEKGYYAIAFRKADAELAAQVDGALDRLLHNGELRRIYEKWNLWNEDQNELVLAKVTDIAGEAAQAWTLDVYLPLLLDGAWVTVEISVAGFILAMALGLVVAVCRLYGAWPLRWLAVAYVEFFRGIPVLLLLYFLYYGLPSVSESLGLGTLLQLTALQAAILGFGLNYAAYEAEIYRAGIGSIPAGQWEAAASLGMSRPLTFRRIILPQAIRVILPPMTNDFVALFKDTSVVSIISVIELSKQYQILTKTYGGHLQIGLLTAALYLAMSLPLGYLSRYLEERWGAR